MKNTIITLLIIGLLVFFFAMLPTPNEQNEQYEQQGTSGVAIISGATVFDGHTWLDKTDVVYQNGIIIEVGNGLVTSYHNATVINADGQYLIPGLIDAHTHAWDNALKDAVKFGVTTELDMFTNNAFASTQRPKRHQHDFDVQQADLFSAGTLVTAPKGHGTEYGFHIDTIESASQASNFVKARINEGSDYIKVVYSASSRYMPSIDKATLNAVVNAAHAQGKLAVVHISDYQSAQDAINAGADGLVHGFMSKDDLNSMTQTMAANNQFIIPTLSILASMMGQDRTAGLVEEFSKSPRFNADQFRSQLSTLRRQQSRPQVFKQAQLNIGTMHQAGVMILAGTDAPNPGTAHGISLHGELELLVESGLTPTQALMAATSNVAKAFKLAERGEIAVGKKADFVLLNKNPQDDITNTRTIDKVFKNGYLVQYGTQEKQLRVLKAMSLGNFDADLISDLKTQWYATTDEQFGGNSVVELTRVNNEQGGYLYLKGQLKRKFSFPWAGAFLSFSPDNKQAMDLRHIKGMNLAVKGTAGKYKVLLMSTKQPMRPVEVVFDVTNQWQQTTLSFATIDPVLLSSVTGIVLVASLPTEQFELMVDDVTLIE